MSVVNVSTRSLLLTQSLVGMRAQLGDLQQQLATGKRASDYAGLGLDRGLTVGLRSHLSAIGSYKDTITSVGVRLNLAQSALTRIADIGRDVKAVVAQSTSADGRATAQSTAQSSLGEILGLLNTRAGDRYLFSGLASDQPAVPSLGQLMDGDASHAGFRQVVAERLQADMGVSGLGRLVLSQPTATSVAVAEDSATSPFGFKLAGASTTLSGATVTGPAGSPPQVSVDLGATNPNSGESVSFTFKLPDGTSETITLKATASATPAADEFSIGADSTATAAKLQAKLSDAIGTLARTSLSAASAMAAADDFFNIDDAHPPRRVAGPPFDTATAQVAGTPADTVFWYTGEAGSGSARETAGARVDQSISVNYGLRANEEGIRWQLQNVATLAAVSMPSGDADSAGRASALTVRLRQALDVPPGTQSVQAIQSELAGAQSSLAAAKDRHQQTTATLSDMLGQIEGVSNEDVAARILAMQTSLQASMQTTAKLFQMSILNYI
jgi:flagellin-like hook-associated protein FlgL